MRHSGPSCLLTTRNRFTITIYCVPEKTLLTFYLKIGECNRGGQSGDNILSRTVLNQVVERRSPFNTRIEWFEVPEVTEGAKNGRGAVRYGLAKTVKAELLNFSLIDPWRDEESRDTATETIKLVGIL